MSRDTKLAPRILKKAAQIRVQALVLALFFYRETEYPNSKHFSRFLTPSSSFKTFRDTLSAWEPCVGVVTRREIEEIEEFFEGTDKNEGLTDDIQGSKGTFLELF